MDIKTPQDQAKEWANQIMAMNRRERRKFAKERGLPKIYGSNTDHRPNPLQK